MLVPAKPGAGAQRLRHLWYGLELRDCDLERSGNEGRTALGRECEGLLLGKTEHPGPGAVFDIAARRLSRQPLL